LMRSRRRRRSRILDSGALNGRQRAAVSECQTTIDGSSARARCSTAAAAGVVPACLHVVLSPPLACTVQSRSCQLTRVHAAQHERRCGEQGADERADSRLSVCLLCRRLRVHHERRWAGRPGRGRCQARGCCACSCTWRQGQGMRRCELIHTGSAATRADAERSTLTDTRWRTHARRRTREGRTDARIVCMDAQTLCKFTRDQLLAPLALGLFPRRRHLRACWRPSPSPPRRPRLPQLPSCRWGTPLARALSQRNAPFRRR